MAVTLGVGILVAIGLFFGWYAQTVKSLDATLNQASAKLASKYRPSIVKPTNKSKQAAPSTQAKLEAPSIQIQQPVSSPPVPPVLNPPPQSVQTPRSTINHNVTAMNPGITSKGQDLPAPNAYAEPTPSPTALAAQAPRKKRFDPAAEKKAHSKLYRAQKLEKEGKVRSAGKLYQEIVEEFPGTEAAEIANEHAEDVADMRVDKAQSQLTHAEGLERLNSFDEAKAEYEGVIRRYPDTLQAKRAQERLERLRKK